MSTVVSNTTAMPLGRLLTKVNIHGLTQEGIRAARYRARKSGRDDPYPWVYRARGVQYPLARVDGYNDWAVSRAYPLIKFDQGGSAR